MIKYYVLDTETTGLKVEFNEINQISIIRAEDGEQVTFDIKVLYPDRASREALDVQGKTLADLEVGQPLEEVVASMDAFMAEDGASASARCVVAHNAPFDRKFCHAAWKSVNKVFPADLWLCTKQFAQRYVKKNVLEHKIASVQNEPKPRFGLNKIMQGVGLSPKLGAHAASVDTENAFELFKWLLETKTEYVSLIKREPQNREHPTDLDVTDY